VLIHAVCDALLGAAGLGDIGEHFPDTDPKYKGISSLLLLKHVVTLVEKRYHISNIDITLILQKPRISPYKKQMAENIRKITRLEKSQLNIKATTTEKLGFIGRMEGAECRAVTLLVPRGKGKRKQPLVII
jgi:2-C-methyl-D-erythritol 2,4-cyclodiphosphate synthase